MIVYVWRKIKTVPILRNKIADIYYFFKKNRYYINGINNVIKLNLENNFPFIKNVLFEIVGNNNTVVINSGIRVSNIKISICGQNNRLIIEENIQMGGGNLWINGDECQLVIGKSTTINGANIGASETKSSIIIGEDCMLAHGIDIRCSDSHSIIDLNSNQRINYAENIHIHEHVWIAANAQILKGVNIGKNSIIAAGSIVTKDLPENCIAAGVPAQVKRTNVTWLRENIPRNDDIHSLNSSEVKNL